MGKTTRLLGRMMKGRFKDARGAVLEALKKGKKKGEKILDDLDLHPEDMGDFLKELWTDFSGVTDDATKSIIVAGLKKASMKEKLKFIEPLSLKDREELSLLSPEMKIIVFHCSRLLSEGAKMIFPKVRTVKDLAEIQRQLHSDGKIGYIDFSSYPPDATVIGTEKGKAEGLVIEFYLERGDYGRKMVRLASIAASRLYE